MQTATQKEYVVLDGPLISIDRLGMPFKTDRLYYLGNLKDTTLTSRPHRPRRPVDLGRPRPTRPVHDVKAARRHGLSHALTGNDIPVLADRGHQGAGGTLRGPRPGRQLAAGPAAASTVTPASVLPANADPPLSELAPTSPPALLPTT